MRIDGRNVYKLNLRTEMPENMRTAALNWVIGIVMFKLVCLGVLFGLLYYFSQNVYYLYFILPIIVLDICVSIFTTMRSGNWYPEEFLFFDVFTSMFQCIVCYADSTMYISRWRIVTFWCMFLLILTYLSPLAMYLSINGISSAGLVVSLAQKSSCNHDHEITGTVYNPHGVFPFQGWAQYSDTIEGVFCTIDQTWAEPNLDHYVKGYAHLSLSVEVNCNVQEENGYVDTTQCVNSYPDPTIGIINPITPFTTNQTVELCPGNTQVLQCLNTVGEVIPCPFSPTLPPSQYVPGRPRKICSVCLNYWRQMTGDFTGPAGYEHCSPYDVNLPVSNTCWFCPGRGYGTFANSKYTTDDIIVEFWLSTSLIIFAYFIDWVLFSICCAKLNQMYVKQMKEKRKNDGV